VAGESVQSEIGNQSKQIGKQRTTSKIKIKINQGE
jgi:hypothetical protein